MGHLSYCCNIHLARARSDDCERGIFIYIWVEINLQAHRAFVFVSEFQAEALTRLGFEIGGVFPELVCVKGFGTTSVA